MKFSQQRAAVLLMLILLVGPMSLVFAQDDNQDTPEDDTTTVVGSGIVSGLFDALIAAGEVELNAETEIIGSDSGLQRFCQGNAGIALAIRPLNLQEGNNCQNSSVEFLETVIGYDGLALITNPDVDYYECINSFEFDTIFAPSARGQVTDWSQVNSEFPANDLSIFIPPQNTTAFVLLDRFVDGDGVRSDAVTEADDAAIVASVAETPGSIGVVNLTALDGAADVRVLELNNAELAQCYAPSVETIENRTYTGANRLFMYVAAENLTEPGVTDLLTYVANPDSAETVREAGFTPVSDDTYATLSQIVTESQLDRVFSRDVTAFEIPFSVQGTVNVGGSAGAFSYMESITQSLGAQYPSLTTELDFEGVPAGLRRLCNGEIDIVALDHEPTAEDLENCDANGIETLTYPIGTRATVLVSSASNEALACLTTDQLVSAFQTQPEDTLPMTWNAVDESLPEDDLFLFVPALGDSNVDLMMISANGTSVPVRSDLEVNADPLFRAAAVSNVDSGLAVVSWQDYQTFADELPENNQENIQLVAVDSGDGCVTPSEETITDSSYPLTRSEFITVSTASLATEPVQSFVWFMFSDANHPLFELNGLVGVPFEELSALRDELQTVYDDAVAAAAAADALQLPDGGEEDADTDDTTDETDTSDSDTSGDEDDATEGESETETEDESGDTSSDEEGDE